MILFKLRKFKAVFGFEWTLPIEDFDTVIFKAVEQKVVDCRLTELAEVFAEADRREQSIISSLREAESPTFAGLLGAWRSLKDNRAGLLRAKANFWRAHELAKTAGFSVKEKYTDYLPDPFA